MMAILVDLRIQEERQPEWLPFSFMRRAVSITAIPLFFARGTAEDS